jgi:cAMP phosphodiesterase
MGEVARRKSVELNSRNTERIFSLYTNALNIIEKTIEKEKNTTGTKYSHSTFFRSNKSKKYFEDLEEDELSELLGQSSQ